jgi:hypothetical protein
LTAEAAPPLPLSCLSAAEATAAQTAALAHRGRSHYRRENAGGIVAAWPRRLPVRCRCPPLPAFISILELFPPSRQPDASLLNLSSSKVFFSGQQAIAVQVP